jgi:hypothetical protein
MIWWLKLFQITDNRSKIMIWFLVKNRDKIKWAAWGSTGRQFAFHVNKNRFLMTAPHLPMTAHYIHYIQTYSFQANKTMFKFTCIAVLQRRKPLYKGVTPKSSIWVFPLHAIGIFATEVGWYAFKHVTVVVFTWVIISEDGMPSQFQCRPISVHRAEARGTECVRSSASQCWRYLHNHGNQNLRDCTYVRI